MWIPCARPGECCQMWNNVHVKFVSLQTLDKRKFIENYPKYMMPILVSKQPVLSLLRVDSRLASTS